MKVLLNIIVSTFGALGNLILVLLITLYIFAVLGLQVVGEYYTKKAFDAQDNEDEFPRCTPFLFLKKINDRKCLKAEGIFFKR